MVTRRCTQRQYLLRPDKVSNNAVIYCLAVAARRAEIDVVGFVQMSNHLHEVIYDRHGRAPEFYEHFHKLLAKCMNAARGRWENFFSSEQVCVVRLEGRDALIDKLAYVAANPVKDHLVARVEEWPGENGYRALVTGVPLRATRPEDFFVADGDMPAEIELHVRVPPELGDAAELVAALTARVRDMEESAAAERKRRNTRPLGAHAVRSQDWRTIPATQAQRRRLKPTVATRDTWERIEALQLNKDFAAGYNISRVAMRAGSPIPFPFGTYWLRRYVGVAVAPLENC